MTRVRCGWFGRRLATMATVALLAGTAAHAADWPCYMADAARSGVTAEELKFPLARAWTYRPSRPPRPAWREPGVEEYEQGYRLDFDAAPEPVVAGRLVYLGSTTDDTVRALDLSTGKVEWQFTTGGPVRFAPAIYSGKAYVASDDGWLYCLDGATGKLVWRFRAAMSAEQVIGNSRMISRWPLRSGVLVEEGTVYITAGMWPAEGICVYALDAAKGDVIWCNDTSGSMLVEQPHNGGAISGVAPQGYLLASKDTLLVPTGRGLPAAYERSSGRLRYYRIAFNQYQGGVWCILDEPRNMVITSAYSASQGDRTTTAMHLPSGGRRSSPTAERVLVTESGEYGIYKGNLSGPGWQVAHPGRVRSLALAGGELLVCGEGGVTAYEAASGSKVWHGSVEGEVRGVAVASGRLVVTTDSGAVLCYGPAEGVRPNQSAVQPGQGGPVTAHPQVAELLKLAEQHGISRGYALVLGSSDAQLAEALAARTQLHVIAVLRDAAGVAAERARLMADTDLYGTRVAVQHLGDLSALPYPQYFANLLVVAEAPAELSGKELYRLLRPCGGVLCFPGLDGATTAKLVRQAEVPDGEARGEGDSLIVVRGKLPGAFDWDSTVPCDERVKWPLRLLWFGAPGPARILDRHAAHLRGKPPVAANGRYFIFGSDHVIAVDAYNGTELWAREIPDAAARTPRLTSLSADDDHAYLNFGHVCYQLDAQTGETEKIYGTFKGAKQYSLAEPRSFKLEAPKDWLIANDHTGTVTLTETDAGLELVLTTEDRNVSDSDAWELFFDFRPATERFDLSGRGLFQVRVQAKAGTYRPGFGVAHPAFTIEGKPRPDGTEVTMRLTWEEMEKVAGSRPEGFAFAARLKASSKDRYYLNHGHRGFVGVLADWPPNSMAFNDGWPTFAFRGGPGAPEATDTPEKAFEPLGNLPVYARQWGRMPARADDQDAYAARGANPLTGVVNPKTYMQSYGCGGTIHSATADFLRSSTVGIYDFADNSGMRHFGGVRPSCGVPGSMVPALGLLIPSEGSSGCWCSFNFQTSFALAPTVARRNEDWALFHDPTTLGTEIKHFAVNLSAPGDRRDDGGALWMGYPRSSHLFLTDKPGGTGRNLLSLPIPLHLDGYDLFEPYRVSADRVAVRGTDRPWIYCSGYRGLKSATFDLAYYEPNTTYLSSECARPPKIDGVLTDACWDGSLRIPVPREDACVFMRHDADNLYVAYTLRPPTDREGRRRPWRMRTKGEDAPVWQDDAEELCIKSSANPTRILHLGVSASGARYDAFWRYRFDIPEVGGIVVDGKPDDWGDGGLRIHFSEQVEFRAAWHAEGLALLLKCHGQFGEDRVRARLIHNKISLIAGKGGAPGYSELALNTKARTCVVERHAADGSSTASAAPPATTETTDDYVVETVLPWGDIGVLPKAGNEVEFLILAYNKDFDRNSKEAVQTREGMRRDGPAMCLLRLADKPSAPVKSIYPYGQWFADNMMRRIVLPVDEDSTWNGKWSSAARANEDAFTAEVAIPWQVLKGVGIGREQLTVTFGRHGRRHAKVEPLMGDNIRTSYPGVVLRDFEDAVPKRYTVRLHFAEPDDVEPGQRVFDVALQGRTVVEGLDVLTEAGGRNMALVKEFKGVLADKTIALELTPKARDVTSLSTPILNGVEILTEDGE